MARRNYKIEAYIGHTRRALKRYSVVLDTGAGSSFLKAALIPDELRHLIRPLEDNISVRDASNRIVMIGGTITLVVNIGNRTSTNVTFNVVERLGTDVILGCDFCDSHVEAIRPRLRVIELTDGTAVPIIKGPPKRSSNLVPLPKEQEFVAPTGRASRKICVNKTITLEPQAHTWVPISTPQVGLVQVEPYRKLYETRQCVASHGIAHIEPRQQINIMIANFGNKPITLLRGQRVATANPQPAAIAESNISHAQIFGIESDAKQIYRKRDFNARDTALINQYLADSRNSHMNEEEKPVTAEDIELSEVEQKYHPRIREMLKRHEAMWNGRLGEIKVAEHAIDLKEGAKPFKSAPYRSGPTARQLESFELKKQLEAGVIEPAVSEWAAPVLFVPKKDGQLRFCVDYRRLNEMTLKDSYPLPRMDDCIDSLGQAKIFSTLDAYSGYWQMHIREEDRPKTAFVTHSGTYQYIRMPFGLTNAPASFQRALDVVLTKYKWETCLVYLDDIIIYSNNVEDHIDHVDEILTSLNQAGITLKIKKCKFFTKTVEYLGHIIMPGKLEIDHAHTASLREALPPTNKSELRSFLGLCNVYRRFVENFAHKAGCLHTLLQKHSPEQFSLNNEQLGAFRNLIDVILSPPALSLPQLNLPYSVDTDASAYGLGCSLHQTSPTGARNTIGYWSRSLVPAERNYSAPERECLAVVWALKTLRPYLLYETFIVHTDHAALRWLLTIQEPSGRLMRWRLRLAEYNFQVHYKKGPSNVHADALSRLRTTAETTTDDWDEIPSFSLEGNLPSPDTFPPKKRFLCDQSQFAHCDNIASADLILDASIHDELFAALPDPTPEDPLFRPISMEELAVAQFHDAFCVDIRRRLNEGVVLAFGENENGLLCRKVSHDQIVIPHALKQRVLHIHHYARLAGHPGGRKLYQSIRKDMYWPALAVDCYATVRRCSTCAKNRIQLRLQAEPLQLFPASGPLESVAIDVLGELIKTVRGNQYLLIISDRFTKLTKSVPLKSISAAEVAKAFVNEWVFNYGPPKELISDNGKCFTAKFFQDVCRILNIQNSFTTTYHPQTNGQVERYNRTLKAAIRSYLNDHPKDWDLYTSSLTYAYNCVPHTATASAPFELVLSRPPPPLALEAAPRTFANTQEARSHWKRCLEKSLGEANNRLEKAQRRYKRNFDARLRKQKEIIAAGDNVYLRVERRNEDEHRHKLAAVAEGPYPVLDVKGKTVVIQRRDNTVERVSRDRVINAPAPRTAEEIERITRPMAAGELTPSAFPSSEELNARDISTASRPPGSSTNVQSVAHEREGPPPSPGSIPEQPPSKGATEAEEPQEFVMERIIGHGRNEDTEHPSAQVGETTYRIRWYGFDREHDTFEPIRHIPRSKVVSYYKRIKRPPPENIDDAQSG